MLRANDIREEFRFLYEAGLFTSDRSGGKTIEIIGASFIADEPAIFGEPNQEYINAEIDWYKMRSTNINDIYGTDYMAKSPPAAWKMTANKHGEINSNYGRIIYSDQYYDQYNHVLNELQDNPGSRRATMVYNRPSIWCEYNENGKSDFICTNAVTYYIRGDVLHAVVQMRSNDVVFGYKNDYAWQRYVMQELINDHRDDLRMGTLHWQVQNLHIYDRHFGLIL